LNNFIEQVLRKKDENVTLLEIISELIERDKLDVTEVAKVIKNDKTFLSLLKYECEQMGLLKIKNNQISLEELMKKENEK